MPNYETHSKTGVYTGLFTGAFFIILRLIHGEDIDTVEGIKLLGLGALGGFIGAALPDVFEPSFRNPNHRGIAHSVAGVGFLSIGVAKRFSKGKCSEQDVFVTAFGVGYLSHLVLDARTPKGLPFFS